ncbi:MAG: phenylalanine--tRNA ligase subunit alpha [Candidatus Kapabacteria bacterium]|nr:phenylalanine--tRNA ligase subunit alpha [Candidatus Kapabacteria bacterium]
MIQEINRLRGEIESALNAATNGELLEQFRLQHLVQKGTLRGLMDRLREVPKDEKPSVGKALNELRTFAESEFKRLQETFGAGKKQTRTTSDLSLPGRALPYGTAHPVHQTMEAMIDIFVRMGFDVARGPEVESDYYNFEALNFAADHPARDMQDTFFMKGFDKAVLRTHTTPVQIRLMKEMAPPIRAIMPGRVYRNEAISARALAEFHQLDGIYVDKGVSFAELKGTMLAFAKQMYGNDIKYRFRASYFPFTEPSAEMDITCFLCKGEGCRVCKYSGWLEIVGCGMVHPNVLTECGIDPEIYSGYAFGFGIERVTMLRTGIDDIRLLYENDVRMLKQF